MFTDFGHIHSVILIQSSEYMIKKLLKKCSRTKLRAIFGHIHPFMFFIVEIFIIFSYFGHILTFMFVIVVIFIICLYLGYIHLHFSQVHSLIFVSVNFRSHSNVKVGCFWSNSNQFLVILIRSS